MFESFINEMLPAENKEGRRKQDRDREQAVPGCYLSEVGLSVLLQGAQECEMASVSPRRVENLSTFRFPITEWSSPRDPRISFKGANP
jgi:hypothetical protein